MNRTHNIINKIISVVIPVILIVLTAKYLDSVYAVDIWKVVLCFFAGAIFWGAVNAFVHELGHLIGGKSGGFTLISFSFWFFNWKKVGKEIRFFLSPLGEDSGYTEMIPTDTENLSKKYLKMTRGGIIASFIMTILGILPFFLRNSVPSSILSMLIMMLPISSYYFLGTFLATETEGTASDGLVAKRLRKNSDYSKVELSLMTIHCELNKGKTPAQIDKSLYFSLPQLREDCLDFILLTDARYSYYLDIGDYENAKKCLNRLESLFCYEPKSVQTSVKVEQLYLSSIMGDNYIADDLMDELDKFLNSNMSATIIRAKLAYLINVLKDNENVQSFYQKGIELLGDIPISGIAKYEKNLLDKLIK